MMKLAGVILGLAAVFSHSDTSAQERASRLFPDAATACFAAGIPPRARLSPLSDITSLIVRPRDPETDGDGDYPPEVESKLEPAGPNEIPLTLIATFAGGEETARPGKRWGSRFSCGSDKPDDDQLGCTVDDWCSDVGFNLYIEGETRIRLEILPDAGPLGELGNPCADNLVRMSLNGTSNEQASYLLNRQPAGICR